MKLPGKYAVITGGTSGIGLALTRAMQAKGVEVLVIGRDPAKLAQIHDEGGGITTLAADVADVAERRRVVEELLGGPRPIDVFINNAGTMQFFALGDDDALRRIEAELALDLHAPLHFCTALLPHLTERPQATLVNVSTGLVYAPYAGSPAYGAAKNGLHAFTQSLRRQTRDSGLTVLEVFPPTVDTDLTKGHRGAKMSPDAVAKAVVTAITKDAAEARIGQSKALYAMSRLAPSVLFEVLNRAIDKSAIDPVSTDQVTAHGGRP